MFKNHQIDFSRSATMKFWLKVSTLLPMPPVITSLLSTMAAACEYRGGRAGVNGIDVHL